MISLELHSFIDNISINKKCSVLNVYINNKSVCDVFSKRHHSIVGNWNVYLRSFNDLRRIPVVD